jgi:hypothetical protein
MFDKATIISALPTPRFQSFSGRFAILVSHAPPCSGFTIVLEQGF